MNRSPVRILLGALTAMALMACGSTEEFVEADIASIPPGEECPAGGFRITLGDEEPIVVCNGADGIDGLDGASGADGDPGPAGPQGADGATGEDGLTPDVALEAVEPDADGPCGLAGGTRVTVTVDGDLVAEEVICDGAPGEDGAPGSEVLVASIDGEDPDSPCGDAGGVVITAGDDREYVCNGADGTTPGIVVTTVEPGDDCPFGGVEVTLGDEEPFTLCNGEDGAAGEDGDPGTSPEIIVTPLEAGDADCPAGGFRIAIEGQEAFAVCNGEDGEPGTAPAVLVNTVEPGDLCPSGGWLLTVDEDEFPLCNGEDGSDGTAPGISTAVIEPDPSGVCPAGGFAVSIDGQDPITLCNGEDGQDGQSPSVSLTPIEAGDEDCPSGGLLVGIDGQDPFPICNGEPGEPGEPGVSPAITVAPIAEGDDDCPGGGWLLTIDGTDYPVCNGVFVQPFPFTDCRITDVTPDVGAAGDPVVVFLSVEVDFSSEPPAPDVQVGWAPSGASVDDPSRTFEPTQFVTEPIGNTVLLQSNIVIEVSAVYDFIVRFAVGDDVRYCDTEGFFVGEVAPAPAELVVQPGPLSPEPDTVVTWDFGEEGEETFSATDGIEPNLSREVTLVEADFTGWVLGPFGTRSPNSNGWGFVGGSYWQAEFSTEEFYGITLFSVQRSSNTGPRDFVVQWSVDGTTFNDLVELSVANDFTTGVVDQVLLPLEANDQPSVTIRWTLNSDTAVSGNPLSINGTSRIGAIGVFGNPL
ncbi:MAG: collagen-like protein [Deltaproteobacteria bacterium]|nr:MAG: collagen-like protein [Deltaproteobacteria bacterium]